MVFRILLLALLALPASAQIVIRVNKTDGGYCIATPAGVVSSKFCEDGDDGGAPPPTTPELGNPVVVNDDAVDLSLATPSTDGTPPLAYELVISPGFLCVDNFTVADADATFTDGIYQLTGLTAETSYCVKLAAVDSDVPARRSGYSQTRTFTTAAAPGPDVINPTEPVMAAPVSNNPGEVTVSWGPSTDVNLAKYIVIRGVGDTVGSCNIVQTGTDIAEVGPSTLSFVDSTAGAGTVKFYRVYAVDLAGNQSTKAPRQCVQVDDVPSGNAVKWNPGHMMLTNGAAVVGDETFQCSQVEAIENEPNIVGVHHRMSWAMIEGAQGVYDFSEIDAYMACVIANGKSLTLQPKWSAKPNQSAASTFPSYLSSLSGGGGGYLTENNGAKTGKMWNAPVMSAFIAMTNAIASHVVPNSGGLTMEEHPNFLGITTEESTFGAACSDNEMTEYSGGNACKAAVAVQLKRWATEVKPNFPTTNVYLGVNYLSNQIDGLFAHVASVGVGVLGPDTVPNAPTDAQEAMTGTMENGSSGPDYCGVIPALWQIQGPELGGKEGTFTMTALGNAAAAYCSSNQPWLRKGGSSPNWVNDIEPYLTGTPAALETDCPSVYDSCVASP